MDKIGNEKLVFFATVLYFVGSYIADTITGGALIFVLALGMMCFVIFTEKKGIVALKDLGFLKYLLFFILFCMASRLWAEDQTLAVSKINGLLFLFLGVIIFHFCYIDHMFVEDLLKAIMYGGYIVIVYAFLRYGINGIWSLVADNSRISNEVFNSNTIGICAANTILINLYFIAYDRMHSRDIFMLPALVLLIVSQSRKAIFIVAIGVISIYVFKNLKRESLGKVLFKLGGGLAFIIVIFIVISKLPFMQTVMGRLDDVVEMITGEGTRANNTAWIRFAYTELGIQLFHENPLVGVGIGNANIYTQLLYGHNHYLHNNYVELLACGGIIGFLFYYSMHIHLLSYFFRLWRQRDKEYNICFIILIQTLILDYGMVSYYSRVNYLFLYMIWLKIKQLQRKNVNVFI